VNTGVTLQDDYYLSLGRIESDDCMIPEGTQLCEGRYRIDRLLNRGIRAHIYVARDVWRNMPVALKLFQDTANDDRMGEVTHELRVMSGIDSEHILRVYDAMKLSFKGRKLFAIVMEYADGGNFRDWLQHTLLDPEHRRKTGLDLLRKICKGVAKLHDSGIVHLDIKPENILFCGSKPKLADFGFSNSIHTKQTQGSQGGTIEYMSPEQFMENCPVDASADVYALGVMLYEIMHPLCSLPFSGKYDYLKSVKTRHLPARINDIQDDLWNVILTCMQIDPTKRYRNASRLLEAIDMISCHPSSSCDLWTVVCRQIETGDLFCAHNNCRQLVTSNPDHADALNILQQLDSRYQQALVIYNSINRDLLISPFSILWSRHEQAEQLYPGHPEASTTLSALNHTIQQYRILFEKGIHHISQNSFDLALVCFQKAKAQFPGQIKASELEQMILNYKEYENDSIHRINGLMEQRHFQTALELAGEFDTYAQDIQDKAREICSEFNQ